MLRNQITRFISTVYTIPTAARIDMSKRHGHRGPSTAAQVLQDAGTTPDEIKAPNWRGAGIKPLPAALPNTSHVFFFFFFFGGWGGAEMGNTTDNPQ